MSQDCNTGCSDCKANCASNPNNPNANPNRKSDLLAKPHELSRIRKVIGVVSGKGGVGKSMVTSLLAILMNRRNYKTAILDADITGPSIPKAFGLKEPARGSEAGMFPVRTKMGIEVMSLNLLTENETDPVLWRGPILGNSVKQFWTEVIWNDVDIMFLDMPPGTGDIPLTVYQSIPIEGVIIVTTPQDLVSMIVGKAMRMAEMMNIPILGMVENMSYALCPNCNEKIELFGTSKLEEIAHEKGIEHIARIPISKELSNQCDRGLLELFEGDWLDSMADMIESRLIKL